MYEISELTYTRADMLNDLKRGLTPLEIADRKWKAILSGGEDFGSSSCACCETYFEPNNKSACLGTCPLGNTEGCCSGLYSAWIRHQNEKHMDEHISYAIRCPECEEIAQGVYGAIKEQLEKEKKEAGALLMTG